MRGPADGVPFAFKSSPRGLASSNVGGEGEDSADPCRDREALFVGRWPAAFIQPDALADRVAAWCGAAARRTPT